MSDAKVLAPGIGWLHTMCGNGLLQNEVHCRGGYSDVVVFGAIAVPPILDGPLLDHLVIHVLAVPSQEGLPEEVTEFG